MATTVATAMRRRRNLTPCDSRLATAVPLLVAFLLLLHAPPLAEAQPLPWQMCDTAGGNYTEGSTYQANVRALASALPVNASSSRALFAKGAAGAAPDVVYAIALCRGDTNASSCAACVATAFQDAQQLCAFNRRATMFDDPCILRYSDQDILANATDGQGNFIAWNYNNVSAARAAAFDAASGRLVNATAGYAAADPVRRFGTGEVGFDDATYPRIFSLAQCTPDLSEGRLPELPRPHNQVGAPVFRREARRQGLRRAVQLPVRVVLVLLRPAAAAVAGAAAGAGAVAGQHGATITTGDHGSGYMAPEYAMRGQYSVKSDAFSFGVLIIEIVTGRRNSSFSNSEQSIDLLSLVWEHWTTGTIEELLNPAIGSRAVNVLLKLINIGLLCVQDNPADRPAMSAVNVMLSSDTVSLQAPSRPTFSIQEMDGAADTDLYESGAYPRSAFQPTGDGNTRAAAAASPNELSLSELEPR
ncbi:hypothetical protein OsJ_24605 [Oryza sativa Japonica Group]|uniref:Gnk2-homologous domain-containing protein n=1 Tax=Oryza sativa subsp. japonica TaxID=39947 RepID=B9FXQ7_ORYSJ|nr:hypothetical protein OsJ_24605 [Oryza sativa Japonica Group]